MRTILWTILGAGIGFGIGFALGSYTMTLIAQSDERPLFIGVVVLLVMLVIPAIVSGITRSCLVSIVFYVLISGVPLGIFFAIALGGETLLFPAPIFLTIPFVALGGVVGYKLSAKRKPLVAEAERYDHKFRGGEQETAGGQEEEGRYDKYDEEEGKEFRTHSRVDDTYYEILGVKPSATKNEIRRAYREKMKEYHPDKFMDQPEWVRKKAEEMSKKLNEAYEALMKERQKGS